MNRSILKIYISLALAFGASPQAICSISTGQITIPQKAGIQSFPLAAASLGTSGRKFSIEVALRPGALAQPGMLFRIMDAAHLPAIQLLITPPAGSMTPSRQGSLVQFLVTTDFRPAPLALGFPVQFLDSSSPHKLVLRDLGFRLDLFVDGVLADQEWPIGRVASQGAQNAEATSAIAAFQIRPEILSDTSIEEGNGGKSAIADRERRYFGPDTRDMQYWRPRGYNTSAGDAMPFFHDGVLHVFYLMDRRHHHSKWGLGAHQWGHISTTDLVNWKTYPAALTIENEQEASICTGSVFFNDGKFYAFYATRMPDRSERLSMAMSNDGVTFHKLSPTPFDEPKPPYRRGPNRDPFVFGSAKDFHMTVTASLASPASPDQAGALEHLTSPDLKTWKVEPSPFLITGYAADPECSDVFLWHGWYYLLFSENGQAHYRMSRSSSGPWTKPTVDVFDGTEARVMKTAAFNGDRRIGVAFVPDGDFGGNLVYREIVQTPDGLLSAIFLREMIPVGTPGSTPSLLLTGEGVEITPGKIFLKSSTSVSIAHPENFIFRATLTPGSGATRFGIRFGTAESSATLEFNPAQSLIQWQDSSSSKVAGPLLAEVGDLGKPVKIELVSTGKVVDIQVNGRHTLVHRLPCTGNGPMRVFSDSGDLAIADLTIEALRK